MTSGTPKTLPYKVLEPTPAPPLVTLLLIFLPIFLVLFGVPSINDSTNINWVDKFCFTAAKMSDVLNNPLAVLQLMFAATFAQLSGWMWGINGVFFWVFGHILEKRLKAVRYATLIFALVVTGWLMVFIFGGPSAASKSYIGPSLLLFGMLGGYFAFLPRKPFKPQNWVQSTTQIFRNEQETPLHERYWVSPWIYIIGFVAWEAIMQVALYLGPDALVDRTHIDFLATVHALFFGRMNPDSAPYAFHPIAAIANIAIGACVAPLLPKLAMVVRPKRPGGKLQLEVIQHYRELRTLDMTHDQACEGAAKFAAVPIDTAKDWISKGAAGLKDQDLR